ncbi:YbaY family lipoprotein [Oxalicibacterium faecigallinarum]|uniref:C-type lysozyme inhibitor domain-containing protein n=1 Tax=Oxalicibacterium faecigallinarum TaxID=573741 RepID=A0A8J3AS83_9BURK|nr:YbaY family lipoprotein [Oxalicibacterium faecigallinarum]GGI20818.1 hypothetical protein GCM10008066_25930 [Oxalicibacterium faecigallinarum]
MTISPRFTAILLATTLLAGCSMFSKKDNNAVLSGNLTGSVTYRERIALPPDAKVIVSLEDTTRKDRSAEFVAQQVLEPKGQVPVAFNLRYIPSAIDLKHRYAINAAIIDGADQLLWSTDESVPVNFAEQDKPIAVTVNRMLSPVAAPVPAPKTAMPFKCDEISLIARFSDGVVEIALPGRTISLPQVVSASGARYTDGQTLFWNKGDTALFEMNGKKYTGCLVDRQFSPAKSGPAAKKN